jgi:hypothetical protein
MASGAGGKQADIPPPDLYYLLNGRALDANRLGSKNTSIIISYMAMRQLIGILGILLPFICILGGILFSGLPCQRSISFYYHTNMRDFLSGILLAVSIFLITYKGYRKLDSVVTSLIGIAGIGVALFPCLGPGGAAVPAGLFQVGAGFADVVHMGCAALFFILLALNSLFLFTLSTKKDSPPGSNKNTRNAVYVVCGGVILISLLLFVILYLALGRERFGSGSAVLILESVMLLAFGVSWLVKGEAIFKDAKEPVKPLRTGN